MYCFPATVFGSQTLYTLLHLSTIPLITLSVVSPSPYIYRPFLSTLSYCFTSYAISFCYNHYFPNSSCTVDVSPLPLLQSFPLPYLSRPSYPCSPIASPPTLDRPATVTAFLTHLILVTSPSASPVPLYRFLFLGYPLTPIYLYLALFQSLFFTSLPHFSVRCRHITLFPRVCSLLFL